MALRPAPSRHVLTTLLLVAAPGVVWAHALEKGVFGDDFESGLLDADDTGPVAWDARDDDVDVTQSASPSAAHRGGFGYRLVDAKESDDGGPTTWLMAEGLPPSARDVRLRTWIRITSTRTGGDSLFALVQAESGRYLAEARYHPLTQALRMAGRDAADTFALDTGTLVVGQAGDRWSLVELSLTGVGTAAGRRRLFVDGVEVASRSGIDLTNETLGRIRIGQPWAAAGRWTGVFDLDDVRVSVLPQASRFVVQPAQSSAQVGDCIAASASLHGSEEGVQPLGAPYALEVSLSSTGAKADYFSDAQCQVPLTTTPLAAGASTVSFFVRPDAPGTLRLIAGHVDFVSGRADVSVTDTTSGTGGTAHALALTVDGAEGPPGTTASVSWEVTGADGSPVSFASPVAFTPSPLPTGCRWLTGVTLDGTSATDTLGVGGGTLSCDRPARFELCAEAPSLVKSCRALFFALPADALRVFVERLDRDGPKVGTAARYALSLKNPTAWTLSSPIRLRWETSRLSPLGDGAFPSGGEEGIVIDSLEPDEVRTVEVEARVVDGRGDVSLTLWVEDEWGRPVSARETVEAPVAPWGVAMGCSAAGRMGAGWLVLGLWLLRRGRGR